MKIQPCYTGGCYKCCPCRPGNCGFLNNCCHKPSPIPGFYFCFRIIDCDSGIPLSGAVMQLQNISFPQVQTVVSDANGMVCFCLNPCFSYRLIEQNPPEGYEYNLTQYTVFADLCGNVIVNGSIVQTYDICNNKIIPPLFSVTYDPNGGGGGFTDGNLPAGAPYAVLDETEASVYRFNYDFVSWNTAPDGSGTTYMPGNSIIINEDITLYAQWQEVPEDFYSVTYDANGGSGGSVIPDLPSGALYPVVTDTQAGVFSPGQTFLGWNTMPDGSGTTYMPGDTLMVLDNITLYAQWE